MPEFWIVGNQRDLEVAAILIVAILLEYRYGLIRKFKEQFSFYYVIISFGVFLAWIGNTFGNDFSNYTGQNIIVFRIFGSSTVGHWLVWLSVFVVLARYCSIKDLISGWLIVGVFVAIHEGLWFLAYFVANPQNFYETLFYYSPFLLLLLVMIAAYGVLVPRTEYKIFPAYVKPEKMTFGAKLEVWLRNLWRVMPKAEKLPRYRIYRTVVFMVIFNILWGLAGFPLTVDNITGPTAYYDSVAISLLEDLSWICPALVFIL